MKNTLLWTALFAVVSTPIYADETSAVIVPEQAPVTAPALTTTQTPVTPNQAIPAIPTQPTAVTVIDCTYKIPAETKKVEQPVVMAWSQSAVVQAFTFKPEEMDAQMQKLQACFTEQGWTGFNTALQQSGNLEAIKSQKLSVTSQVEGMALINEAKDNQWKVTVPVIVVYQNDKEKVSQLLSVDLTVSRKPNGDLGIMQMIASPRGTVTTKTPEEPADSNPDNIRLDTKPAE